MTPIKITFIKITIIELKGQSQNQTEIRSCPWKAAGNCYLTARE